MSDHSASPKTSAYAWVILALIYFSSMAAPLNQFKVPPVMGLLISSYGLTLAVAGLLMGIFALIGVILALPSGFIMGRIGVKKAGLAALIFLMAGSALGAVLTGTSVLMTSRVLEGVGMCLMSIVAPTALAHWFPPNKHGLAMGIWGTWVPVSSIISFAVFPKVADKAGWPGVAWSSFGYSVVLFILFIFLFKMPKTNEMAQVKPSFEKELSSLKKVVSQGQPWLLSLSFCGYIMLAISLITFLPTYFSTVRGLGPQAAANASQIYLISNTLGIIVGGLLCDKYGSKRCIVLAYLIAGLLMLFFFAPGNYIYLTMIAVAFIGPIGVTPSFSAAPQLVAPEDAGRAMALLALGQNLGMSIGPPVFGRIAESSWNQAGYFTIPVVLLAAFLASRLKIR
ncbi:MAG: MFS transporter [Deltaproteobacteria bacterium]|jgi:MFS family permease|nr:MFS transporter [Deltaproteobacteria bacterium]